MLRSHTQSRLLNVPLPRALNMSRSLIGEETEKYPLSNSAVLDTLKGTTSLG